MLFQILDYGDHISITRNKRKRICIKCCINVEAKKLVLRAIQEFFAIANLTKSIPRNYGAKVLIKKKIFIGSGVGSLSSNIAVILVRLNDIFKTNFSLYQLSILGISLGADVPLFISNVSGLTRGIGEKIIPIHLTKRYYLLIFIKVSVSTALVLSKVNSCNMRNSQFQIICKNFQNDCETIANKVKKVNEVVNFMDRYGIFQITGTGSTIFATFGNYKEAEQMSKNVPKALTPCILS